MDYDYPRRKKVKTITMYSRGRGRIRPPMRGEIRVVEDVYSDEVFLNGKVIASRDNMTGNMKGNPEYFKYLTPTRKTKYVCPDCGWTKETNASRVRCGKCKSLNLERELPDGRLIKADADENVPGNAHLIHKPK